MWWGMSAVMDVFAARTNGTGEPVNLTKAPERCILLSWTPDSQSVIVAHDTGGNERYQLFQVHLGEPGILHPLTEPSPNYFIRGGQLHPNGKWLIYAANVDPDSGLEIEPTVVYKQNLITGRRTALARPDKGCYYIPRLNSSGTHILYNRKDSHPSGYQLWLADIEGKDDREIVNVGKDKKVYGSWFPDSKRIVIRAETDTHFKTGVWELKSQSLRWLLDDPKRNIESAYVPYGSEEIVLIDVQEARLRSSLLHPDTGHETRLPDTPGNLALLAPVSESEWIGSYFSSQHISDIVRFVVDDLNPGSFKSLTQVARHTRLTSSDLSAAEDFHWKSVDGLTIQGWLYRAKGQARGTIVCVHGGPTSHSGDALDDQIQFFVSQGFNVLDPNYRGSTGFNHQFKEAIKADGWGGKEQDDIRTGIEALIAAGIAEPGKVGITGTSYGGYSSWCAITRFPTEVVAASAPICGMTDLVVDYETTRPDLRPYSEEMMGGNPQQAPERYYQRSPINFVSNIKGRLLIIQGLQDPNVTSENVRAVKKALDTAGIEYQMLTFENEGHGIDRPENLRVLYRRLVEFFGDVFDSCD
jgi:dipeptidyl aminopeptidase/acylaminoacyl peptidase